MGWKGRGGRYKYIWDKLFSFHFTQKLLHLPQNCRRFPPIPRLPLVLPYFLHSFALNHGASKVNYITSKRRLAQLHDLGSLVNCSVSFTI